MTYRIYMYGLLFSSSIICSWEPHPLLIKMLVSSIFLPNGRNRTHKKCVEHIKDIVLIVMKSTGIKIKIVIMNCLLIIIKIFKVTHTLATWKKETLQWKNNETFLFYGSKQGSKIMLPCGNMVLTKMTKVCWIKFRILKNHMVLVVVWCLVLMWISWKSIYVSK